MNQEIISSFENEKKSDSLNLNGLSSVVKLVNRGSICDCYVANQKGRRVFIKKLKDNLKDKPIYRKALEKEYELGCTLNHKSLPDYREIGEDYIIMDFIDGITLKEMIDNNDPWFKEKKNLRKLFLQLLDVIEYLHNHNVIHSDIKSDNIIISDSLKNIYLIDLDKAYTASHNLTAGDPGVYGVNEKESRNKTDFKALGLLVDRIKSGIDKFPYSWLRSFRNQCEKPAPDVADLRNKLLKRRKTGLLISISLFLILVVAAFILFFIYNNTRYQQPPGVTVNVEDTKETENPAIKEINDNKTINRADDSEIKISNENSVKEEFVNSQEKEPALTETRNINVSKETGSEADRETNAGNNTNDNFYTPDYNDVVIYIVSAETIIESGHKFPKNKIEEIITHLKTEFDAANKRKADRIVAQNPGMSVIEANKKIEETRMFQQIANKIKEIEKILPEKIEN